MSKLCWILFAVLAGLAGCDDDDIDSDEEARRAYFGLDASIEASIALGFDGFNAASSANIDPQMTVGLATGTLVISGQVDQGSSANKGMRLRVGMVDYSDGPFLLDEEGDPLTITYDTAADVTVQPALTLQLKNIPDGTLEGSLVGTYFLEGSVEGEVLLDLTIAGTIRPITGTDDVERVPGNTVITGTATSGDGVYVVDLTL